MSKAKEITGLDCNADVLTWANKVLRVRFEEILEKRDAALHSEDIEGVHDMRVATRRLRSALRDFAPLMRKKPLKKVKKELKNIADALGEARDADVAIEAIGKLGEKERHQKIKNDIAELVEDRKTLRERAQLGLLETLSAAALEDLRVRFEQAIGEAATRKKSAKVITFEEAGRWVVGKSLREFCDLSASIYEPLADEPLHKLRIAAKRLRYAVELYTACWGERIAPFADAVAQMQSFLGEVHDADMWLEDLSVKLKNKHGESTTRIRLLSEFVNRRTKNYCAALKLWSEWKDDDFIEKMKTTVSQKSS